MRLDLSIPYDNADQFEITIKINRKIQNLGDLKTFTEALAEIDEEEVRLIYAPIQEVVTYRLLAADPTPAYGRPKLIRFSIKSPPEFTILAGLGWLIFFYNALGNYRQSKEGFVALSSDIIRLTGRIKGASKELKQIISKNIISGLERTPDFLKSKFHRIGEKLLGPNNLTADSIESSIRTPKKRATGSARRKPKAQQKKSGKR